MMKNMDFKTFLEDSSYRDLASSYKSLLKGVPQDPTHHPEGDVLNHVKLVRKSVTSAISELNKLKNGILKEILENIDFTVDEEEMRILFLSAWLHDIGKSTATTIDGTFYKDFSGYSGKIQAIGHEDEEHYAPQIEKLMPISPHSIRSLYSKNKELIDFIIQHHMDFVNGKFPKRIIVDYMNDGKFLPAKEMKLLLIIMFADKMGRTGGYNINGNINAIIESSKLSKQITKRMEDSKKPKFEGGVEEFRQMLKAKGLPDNVIEKFVKQKFPD